MKTVFKKINNMKRENGFEKTEFLRETEGWRKALDRYLHENALLKTRLAKVLDENNSKSFLATAEDFQNSFLMKDEFLKELFSDITTQEGLINKTELKTIPTVLLKQQKLRNEICRFENNFSELNIAFNNFLNNAIQV